MLSRARHRLLVLEALVALTMAGAILRLLPFRLVLRLVNRTAEATEDGAPAPQAVTTNIGQAVTAAARRLPWKPVCLPKALAASFMLARRGQSSLLYLGVRRDEGRLDAHAWLVAGEQGAEGIVCGAGSANRFSPIAVLRPRRVR